MHDINKQKENEINLYLETYKENLLNIFCSHRKAIDLLLALGPVHPDNILQISEIYENLCRSFIEKFDHIFSKIYHLEQENKFDKELNSEGEIK